MLLKIIMGMLGANWQTSVIGVVGAILYLVLKAIYEHAITAEDVTIAVALAGVALAAKDRQVTGGCKPNQPCEPLPESPKNPKGD